LLHKLLYNPFKHISLGSLLLVRAFNLFLESLNFFLEWCQDLVHLTLVNSRKLLGLLIEDPVGYVLKFQMKLFSHLHDLFLLHLKFFLLRLQKSIGTFYVRSRAPRSLLSFSRDLLKSSFASASRRSRSSERA